MNYNKSEKEYQKCFSDDKYELFIGYTEDKMPNKLFCICANKSSSGIAIALKGTIDSLSFGEVNTYLYFILMKYQIP